MIVLGATREGIALREHLVRNLAPVICALSLAGCGSSEAVSDDGAGSSDSSHSEYAATSSYEEASPAYREPFDEDAARDAAEEEITDESYQSIGSPYGCTDDCSGHEAGFAWRRDNGFASPGNSNSFDEGGRAFDEAVEDRVDEMRSDYENGSEADY